MGILTRRQGEQYVITSDRTSGDIPTNRAPKSAPSDVYEVWAGDSWSAVMTEAKTFDTLDNADEYVKANYDQVIGPTLSTKKREGARRGQK